MSSTEAIPMDEPGIEIPRDARLYNDDLAPTPPSARTWGTYNYAALWIGMAHCIPTYQMASGLVVQGMDWKQALFTIMLGNLIVLVPMLLNSHAGTKYGLPFPVICRASFGVFGANIPAILRALVACGWFGIQTWIGGEALNSLLASQSLPTNIWVCFGAFWLLNVWIIWRGMEAVRWFEGWAAPLVLIVAVILLGFMVHRANGFGPVLEQPSHFRDTADFLKHLPIFLTAQIGFWATLSLNMPDFTRYSKNQKSQMLGQALGLPSTMTFFSAIGVMITSATAIVYGQAIDDPIKLLSKPEFANPIVVLVSLVSIGVATLSVNVAANVVSPAFDLANLMPGKIDFKIGGTITALIGILMCPWKIMEKAGNYIFTWLVGYSALLGPIAGIMVADYWILRRRNLDVRELYVANGRYRYSNGINWWAIVALVIGILPNIYGFFLEATGTKPVTDFQHLAKDIYAFAWIVGFLLSMFVYTVLMLTFERANVEADRALNL
jgi:NCS1 family nucleobase:cation symporter-1